MTNNMSWAQLSRHPLHVALREAKTTKRYRPEQVDKMDLPGKVATAAKLALQRAANGNLPALGSGSLDRVAHDLIRALPEDFELPEERDERLALDGDQDAQGRLKAARAPYENMADEILNPWGL